MSLSQISILWSRLDCNTLDRLANGARSIAPPVLSGVPSDPSGLVALTQLVVLTQ